VQAQVEIFLHARGVEQGNAAGFEYVLALVGQGRGLCRVVVAGEDQHAAVLRSSGRVGVLEHVAAAVDPRPLAVPHGEHAVVLRVGIEVDLLRAPDRGGREVLIDARAKYDVVLVEEGLRFPQRLVETTDG